MTSRAWTGDDGTVDETKRKQTLETRGMFAPLRTTGKPDDVAFAMLYLAADASRFMTGEVLRPNGGVHMA